MLDSSGDLARDDCQSHDVAYLRSISNSAIASRRAQRNPNPGKPNVSSTTPPSTPCVIRLSDCEGFERRPPKPENLQISAPFDVCSENPGHVRLRLEWTGTEGFTLFEVIVYATPRASSDHPTYRDNPTHHDNSSFRDNPTCHDNPTYAPVTTQYVIASQRVDEIFDTNQQNSNVASPLSSTQQHRQWRNFVQVATVDCVKPGDLRMPPVYQRSVVDGCRVTVVLRTLSHDGQSLPATAHAIFAGKCRVFPLYAFLTHILESV